MRDRELELVRAMQQTHGPGWVWRRLALSPAVWRPSPVHCDKHHRAVPARVHRDIAGAVGGVGTLEDWLGKSRTVRRGDAGIWEQNVL